MAKFIVQVKQTQVYEIEVEAESSEDAEYYAENLNDGADELGNPIEYEYDATAVEVKI